MMCTVPLPQGHDRKNKKKNKKKKRGKAKKTAKLLQNNYKESIFGSAAKGGYAVCNTPTKKACFAQKRVKTGKVKYIYNRATSHLCEAATTTALSLTMMTKQKKIKFRVYCLTQSMDHKVMHLPPTLFRGQEVRLGQQNISSNT